MRKKTFFLLFLIGIIYPNTNIAQSVSNNNNEDKGTNKPNNVTSFEDLIVKGKLGVGLPDPRSAVHVNGGIIANDLILYSGLEIMDKNKNSQLDIAPNGHIFSNSKDGFKLRSENDISLGFNAGLQRYNGQLWLTPNKIILNSLVGTDSPDMTLSSKGINVFRNMSLLSSLDVDGDISTNRLNINGTSLLTTSSLFRISNSSGISFGVSPPIGQIKEQLRITEGQVKIDALTELTYGLKIQSGNIVTDSDGTKGIEIEGNGDYIRSKQTDRFFINHAKELCLGVGGSVHSNQMAFKTDGIYVNRDMNIANSKISITGREDELADNLIMSNSSITIDGEKNSGGKLVLNDNEVRLTSLSLPKGGFVLKNSSGEDKLRIYSSGGFIHSNHEERLTINNSNSLRLGVGNSSSDYQMEFQPEAIIANNNFNVNDGKIKIISSNDTLTLERHYLRATYGDYYAITHPKVLTLGAGPKWWSQQIVCSPEEVKFNTDVTVYDKWNPNLEFTVGGNVNCSNLDVSGTAVANKLKVQNGGLEIAEGYICVMSPEKDILVSIDDKGDYLRSSASQGWFGITHPDELRLGANANDTRNGQISCKSNKVSVNVDLSVSGEVFCEKVRVSRSAKGGADFVFEDDYKLRPLSEVEAFVKENKHLPEIASEKTMKEEGLDMGDFQIQLLQKVEEMTLYMIELEKKNIALEEEIKAIKASIQK